MFDYGKYQQLKTLLQKRAQFVPMSPDAAGGTPPPGMDPAAGGMPPPDAGGMSPPGMDPAAGGMPPPDAGGMPPPGMDPAAGGMPPMDPAAGGMPPMDPGDVSPTGEPYMKITPTQLSKLFKQFAEVFKSVLGIQTPQGVQPAVAQQPPALDPATSQKLTELDAKMDAILRG